jgi:hypothetical protein
MIRPMAVSKYWILLGGVPLVAALLLIGFLLLVSDSSTDSFVYTLF